MNGDEFRYFRPMRLQPVYPSPQFVHESQRAKYPPTFQGIEVRVSDMLTMSVEDWFACRSPSRARRRHARGIRTRMVVRQVPSNEMFLVKAKPPYYVVHPELWDKLQRALASILRTTVDAHLFGRK